MAKVSSAILLIFCSGLGRPRLRSRRATLPCCWRPGLFVKSREESLGGGAPARLMVACQRLDHCGDGGSYAVDVGELLEARGGDPKHEPRSVRGRNRTVAIGAHGEWIVCSVFGGGAGQVRPMLSGSAVLGVNSLISLGSRSEH
jgi:hypothetical protein